MDGCLPGACTSTRLLKPSQIVGLRQTGLNLVACVPCDMCVCKIILAQDLFSFPFSQIGSRHAAPHPVSQVFCYAHVRMKCASRMIQHISALAVSAQRPQREFSASRRKQLHNTVTHRTHGIWKWTRSALVTINLKSGTLKIKNAFRVRSSGG